MPEADRSLWDHALDLFLYAPLGLAITAREDLPQLVDKGRQRMSGQVTVARMVGEFAVAEGQRQAGHLYKDVAHWLWAGPPAPTADTGAAEGTTTAPPPPAADSDGAPEPPDLTPSQEAGEVPTSPEQLAIPGYDTLSASQVVQRLPALSAGELAAVQAYEASHRKRRTILNRVAQLYPRAKG
ncbi:MAG TPA: hypothetical protein VE152_04110 [Acidimicrobiales bacterium]|nr:hypothetical protein [Acidimicrobiales bacterium]